MGSNVSWYYSKALQANISLINKIITAETKPWHSPKLSNSNCHNKNTFSTGLIKTSRKYGICFFPLTVIFCHQNFYSDLTEL